MGRRWWAGPGLYWVGSAGPAQPITVSNTHGPARPGPAHHMAARPMQHGLYMGRPDNYLGRAVDLTVWPRGRLMCSPVLKGACAYVDEIV